MKEQFIDIASHCGTDVSSRGCAGLLRVNVISAVAEGADLVVLDFANVRTLSESFADELLGVLVLQRGVDWFRRHLQLKNLTDEHRQTILEVVDFRLGAQPV